MSYVEERETSGLWMRAARYHCIVGTRGIDGWMLTKGRAPSMNKRAIVLTVAHNAGTT